MEKKVICKEGGESLIEGIYKMVLDNPVEKSN